jgi:phospholipid transport system substrate-binding protein
MRSVGIIGVGILGSAAIAIALLSPAWAGPPTDTLREYTEAVQKVLDDPALKAEDRRHERREAVRKVAIEAFDVQETARRALGRHWQQRTPAEREEFVQLFADLLEQTYIAKIDLYGGERLKFTDERIDGDTAVVRARVLTRQGAEVPVEGRMHKKAERWLIYDVAIENVSLIANYRSQFDRIIRTSSYAELVKRLRKHGEFLQDKERRAGGA